MISAIIPALNVGKFLAVTLASLKGAGEVIVVDGGSHDDTREIARHYGAVVVSSSPSRGGQMAAGADAAKGDWLLFLHADTRLEAGWEKEVAVFIRHNEGKAGFFRFAPEGLAGWRARLLAAGVRWRCRWFFLPYGDQGLLISRALYDEVGGYAPLPLMEDVELVRRLGRRRLHGFSACAFTAAAHYRRGYFRRIGRNLFCLALYFIGIPPVRIARLYR